MAKSNLYVGNNYIGNIYAGNQLISQVYRGSTKVYDVYYDGQVLFERSTWGVFAFSPKVKGLYEIILIGAGGGGACAADYNKYSYKSGNAGGGAGGFIRANVYLEGGHSYAVGIGEGGSGVGSICNRNLITGTAGGSTWFQDRLSAYGGGGGQAAWTDTSNPTRVGGAGGGVSYSGTGVFPQETYNGENGYTSVGYNYASGGNSRLGGFGAGGFAHAYDSAAHYGSGTNGYAKITYLRHSTGT